MPQRSKLGKIAGAVRTRPRVGLANGALAFFAYCTNYLIDLKCAVIVDVEATTAVRQAEVTAQQRMIDRTQERSYRQWLAGERLGFYPLVEAAPNYGQVLIEGSLDRMQQNRGHAAKAPWQIPARGWSDILRRAWKDTGERNLSLVAGGVTYYLLLALFPALAALVSVYGLVANPADVMNGVQSLSGMLPPSIVELIGGALQQLVSASSKSLGLGAVIGMAIALWSGVSGMTGIMTALNIAYGQPEGRGFIRFNTTALLLTVVVTIGGLIALALVAGLPAVLSSAGARSPGRWVGLVIEWPLLIVFVMGMIALIYRYGPDRRAPKWKWASPGVIVAAILWIFGSTLFSAYVYHFDSYNKTYGSLGAPLALLTWMWLSVFVVLFGAEINGEAERQTRQDTTAGARRRWAEEIKGADKVTRGPRRR